MSRGPGRIQRTIAGLFSDNPDKSYSTNELAVVAFPGVNRIDKRHRVATIRAADAVASRMWWQAWLVGRQGHELVYINRLDVRSHAHGMVRVQRGHRDHDIPGYIAPGGRWWTVVEITRLRHDGKDEEAETMRRKHFGDIERRRAAIEARLGITARPPTMPAVDRPDDAPAAGRSVPEPAVPRS